MLAFKTGLFAQDAFPQLQKRHVFERKHGVFQRFEALSIVLSTFYWRPGGSQTIDLLIRSCVLACEADKHHGLRPFFCAAA